MRRWRSAVSRAADARLHSIHVFGGSTPAFPCAAVIHAAVSEAARPAVLLALTEIMFSKPRFPQLPPDPCYVLARGAQEANRLHA